MRFDGPLYFISSFWPRVLPISFSIFPLLLIFYSMVKARIPALLTPPNIRRKYNTHMFATILRTELDRD